MENNIKKGINKFLGYDDKLDDVENDEKKKKVIKTDNSIIERIDKIIIAENGKQLLREQY